MSKPLVRRREQASTWADTLRTAADELAGDLGRLRELAADATMAREAANATGNRGVADAYGHGADGIAEAVAALARHQEHLRVWEAAEPQGAEPLGTEPHGTEPHGTEPASPAGPPAEATPQPHANPGPRAAAGVAAGPVAQAAVARAPGTPLAGEPPASAGLIEAQEEERRRLARDIHDGPAQLLANVVFRIDVAQTLLLGDAERARAELEQLKQLVRHSLQDVRKIIFDLRPLALDDLGLVPALRSYVGGLQEKSGLLVDLRVVGEPRRLPTAHEVALFRLVQEALHNVRKHAGTDDAEVELEFAADEVRVTVADHGRGFDPAATAGAADRLGLRSMRERAELFGGTLSLRAAPGRGTVLTARVPVPAPAPAPAPA